MISEQSLTLEDKLIQQAHQLDQASQLSQDWLQHIYDQGLFHLFVPEEVLNFQHRKVKGEQDLIAAAQLIQQYSSIDGNIGWLIQIGAGAGVFAAYLSQDIATHFFGEAHQVVAGSGFVGGQGIQNEKGLNVTGCWKYGSGIGHATMVTANVAIKTGNKEEIRSIIMDPASVVVQKDWNAMGLRATESHSFIANQVEVPHAHTFTMSKENLRSDAPLYRVPFYFFARAVFTPIIIGMMYDYTQEFSSKIDRTEKTRAKQEMETLKSELEHHLTDFENHFYQRLEENWALACNHQWDENLELEFNQTCIAGTSQLLNDLLQCQRYTGMEGNRMSSRLNQILRNMMTAAGHQLLSPVSLL